MDDDDERNKKKSSRILKMWKNILPSIPGSMRNTTILAINHMPRDIVK